MVEVLTMNARSLKRAASARPATSVRVVWQLMREFGLKKTEAKQAQALLDSWDYFWLVGFGNPFTLTGAFNWWTSPQGARYWRAIDDRIRSAA